MDEKEKFDFWYAVNNTEVLLRPQQQLESFGTTTIRYHLVTEMMDSVGQVRVREGMIHAYKPEIIVPDGLSDSMLEGFLNEQAEEYVEWLRQHEQNLMIMKYGFKIKKEEIHTETVHDSADNVVDRVKADIARRDQPMQALVRGVEEPWEVCLIKLMVEMVQQSVMLNARELHSDPRGHRFEIDQAFQVAAKDPTKIQDLARLLQQRDLFQEYEDRFFSLVRSIKG